MKFLLTLFFLTNSFFLIGQQKKFFKQTIRAYELNQKDTINKKVLVTYLDSLRNVITTEDNIANSISGHKKNSSEKEKTFSVIETKTDRLYISAEINTKGDTIEKLIYVYDEKGNRTENYQIRNGDTINGQKRLFDSLGNNTKLYNRNKDNLKYFLRMEWKYDEKANIVECKTFNEKSQLIGLDKYENNYKSNGEIIITKLSHKNGSGFVKQFKQITNKNITTTYYYHNQTGFNYGIKLKSIDGGYKIEEDDENGNLKELKLYDDNNKLIAYVIKTEEKISSE